MENLKKTERTSISRLPDRGSYDLNVIKEILKEGLICHIAFIHEGKPYMLPNMYGLFENTIYIHGSVGSFLQRTLMQEIELCFSVTLLDGLVLARSAFHHSANYRSVVMFGKAKVVSEEAEKMHALKILTDHIVPGRWEQVRFPNKSEMKKTNVLSIPIAEASAKIRFGPLSDDEADTLLDDICAGLIPLNLSANQPVPDVISEKKKCSYTFKYSPL